MENTYGIGIANRYELFYDQDDVTDFETVVTKKKKDKGLVGVTTTAAVPVTAPLAPRKSSEKENKVQPKGQQQQQLTTQKAQPQDARKDQRRGIKEQNNTGIVKKDNENKPITQNGQPRPNFAQRPAGENREERNNRKNRELNGQVANGTDGQQNQMDKSRNNNNNNRNRRNFDGKRRDRQSGSDKTGVKSVDKRDGGGAHNWGTHKTDIDDMNKPVTDGEDTSGEKEGEEVVEEPAAPEEPKEMTLDEYKAQRRAQLLQPQYNIRKAGEGEDDPKWDNMKKLDKKMEESTALKKDDGKKDADGKKKQVLDIEFHFNDGRRGGLGRRGPGAGVGGGPKQNRRRPPRENIAGGAENVGNVVENRPPPGASVAAAVAGPASTGPIGGSDGQRRQRRQRFQRGTNEGQHAPKVDDERDFPSLS
ncbi:SERPINE1 mRNA-binding protein 1-like [Chironomus tepperi]|uniref:SERPINE1 mRNA-binding protein 1-like n=1 Tax=Chironomus tepperi TaxID=113505 RepID=UPI00391F4D88